LCLLAAPLIGLVRETLVLCDEWHDVATASVLENRIVKPSNGSGPYRRPLAIEHHVMSMKLKRQALIECRGRPLVGDSNHLLVATT
jgi:hypothetical protein